MGGTGIDAKWCRLAASSPTPSVVKVPLPNSSTMHKHLHLTQSPCLAAYQIQIARQIRSGRSIVSAAAERVFVTQQGSVERVFVTQQR